jgi:hypothetical protein
LIRAAVAGFDIAIDGLLTPANRPEYYLPLVVGEAVRMKDHTFAQIAATPLPPGLQEQYDADVEYYNRRKRIKNDRTGNHH